MTYLQETYLSINDSRMQRKIRELKPFPVTVVYWQQKGHGEAEIRNEFRTIKQLGFTGLKQICLRGDSALSMEDVELIAIEEGLYPRHYGEAGWEPITVELLDRLQIPHGLSMKEIQQHPEMQKHQWQVMKERVLREKFRPQENLVPLGEPGRGGLPLPERLLPLFASWLQRKYGTLEQLRIAWNDTAKASDTLLTSFDEAARIGGLPTKGKRSGGFGDFRKYMDALRFGADLHTGDIQAVVEQRLAFDPEEPIRTGGHQLFENQAVSAWDLELQAQSVRQGGSFYSSIHLVHHFREVEGEMDRPVYMQARMINDYFKGGWSATWESTGGPAIFSGHFGMGADEGVITRLMLNYVAAGLRGIGIWTWNFREQGWEVGEYALTNLQGQPAPRAFAAGAIAKALQRYRFELWEAHHEPQVGVLYSWMNDAAFARLSMGGYPLARLEEMPWLPSEARIGISRALLNANLPFEYVTERDVAAGLAGRYQAIYVPHCICLSDGILNLLEQYVADGGRLVTDMPSFMIDEYGRVLDTGKGSMFERIFGVSIADFQHTRNMSRTVEGQKVDGIFADLTVTSARAVRVYEETGLPAVTEHSFGRGKAVCIGFEASRMCRESGREQLEQLIANAACGGSRPLWKADKPMTHRLAAPEADHYFLINDGKACIVDIQAQQTYTDVIDAITGEKLYGAADRFHIEVPACSGRWVRCAKRIVTDQM